MIRIILAVLSAQTLFAQSYDIVIKKNDGTNMRSAVTEIDSVIFQETGTVTDIDGNTYKTVKIGTQWWMAENLKVTSYRDGTPIPNVMNFSQWKVLTTDAYCYYEYDSISYKETYGALYNWYAVNGDTNGNGIKDIEIAPDGWHIPTDEEWKELEMFLGMSQSVLDNEGWRGTDEGQKLKSMSGWDSDGDGIDEVGFAAFPGGNCNGADGYFNLMGTNTFFWTTSEYTTYYAWCRNLRYEFDNIERMMHHKKNGFSVRCVKDSAP